MYEIENLSQNIQEIAIPDDRNINLKEMINIRSQSVIQGII